MSEHTRLFFRRLTGRLSAADTRPVCFELTDDPDLSSIRSSLSRTRADRDNWLLSSWERAEARKEENRLLSRAASLIRDRYPGREATLLKALNRA